MKTPKGKIPSNEEVVAGLTNIVRAVITLLMEKGVIDQQELSKRVKKCEREMIVEAELMKLFGRR